MAVPTSDDTPPTVPADMGETVARALAEDIGSGDVTAALIPAQTRGHAAITCREPAVICGAPWVDEVYRRIDPRVRLDWRLHDGADARPGDTVCRLEGPAAAILTGERTALNFLQLLSGTATAARACARAVEGTGTRVLDTRKTLPGLRSAQKYAVRVGGCRNHRMGLYDAVLVKENHIAAAGSIGAAVAGARARHPGLRVEVEVEALGELEAAVEAGADTIMLDNFDVPAVREAVARVGGRAELEVSGNVEQAALRELARTGVDFVSIGALTKNVRAVDFSMRFRAG